MTEALYITNIGSTMLKYKVRVSTRARRLRITVSNNGVTVTLLRGVPVREAEHFIRENGQWVLAQVERASKQAAKAPVLPEDVILWHGVAVQMQRVEEADRKSHIKVEESRGRLKVFVPAGSKVSTRKAAEAWMRANARDEIENKVIEQARRMHANPKAVSIRDQKTRWGSCSGRGTLSFNWRLVMMPSTIMDYVVIHELAHLTEHNHSFHFWNLVAKYYPDYKKARAWLRKNSTAVRGS